MKLNNHISDHLSFQTKYMITCNARSSARYEGFPSPVSSRAVPEMGCNLQLFTSGCACTACRNTSKPSPSLFFLNQSIIEHTKYEHGCILCNRWHCNRRRNHGHLGKFFVELAHGFRTSSGLIMSIPFPLDNRLLLYISHFRTWWVRQHSAHDGKFRQPGNSVAHCQMFSSH